MYEIYQSMSRLWRDVILGIAAVAILGSLTFGAINAFSANVSMADLCRDRQARTEAAKQAFIHTQDPLVTVSRANFVNEHPPPTAKELADFEKRVDAFRAEQTRLANKLFKPVEC